MHGRQREDLLGHRQLAQDRRVAAQAVHRGDDALAEEVPEQDAGEGVDRVVRALGELEAEERAEHHLQHQHHQQRLQHRPDEADGRAPVAHFELAGHQGDDEVAVAVDFAHRGSASGAGRLSTRYGGGWQAAARRQRPARRAVLLPPRRRSRPPGRADAAGARRGAGGRRRAAPLGPRRPGRAVVLARPSAADRSTAAPGAGARGRRRRGRSWRRDGGAPGTPGRTSTAPAGPAGAQAEVEVLGVEAEPLVERPRRLPDRAPERHGRAGHPVDRRAGRSAASGLARR